ncbi:hypothetical protein [Lactiplantibacillus plantarum]|uniref:hypothetical protein n=1 Tax=Lactiplantibacillus plantarum TaxID=1590 RepID=UPI00032A4AF7|nr:hypothetical protein [Lactiplantibacillus plantarum]AGL64777.2 hypothetical protein LBP_cg2031 [Lactiplantibacillus plantarum subsp. plantarum P-8]MBR7567683.1 hypothetical protein [Lactiplantibacillus plantarum]MBR7623964.1 hypothetical protein [Lactiplantibacillus plantarum]MBR7625995.1 hypothetical protein [Lactiplantibacillus plantarum]MBR7645220.1 hypothetical protein [Lactiplantibacillus plantarum]
MKIKLTDTEEKLDDQTITVASKPVKGDTLLLDNGRSVEIQSVYQDENLYADTPEYTAIVEYINGKPVSEMTDQDVVDWFNNPESGLLGDDDEEL